jgi:bifunctional non-homologous end joining protein LigD
VGIRPSVDAETTKGFALALGKVLESRDPKRITVTMAKEQRSGRVFVDWSQNDRHKTTVCAYSLRATETPGVSTPVSWDELTVLADGGDPMEFAFTPAEVIERVDELGDLYADSLAGDQDLPELG